MNNSLSKVLAFSLFASESLAIQEVTPEHQVELMLAQVDLMDPLADILD